MWINLDVIEAARVMNALRSSKGDGPAEAADIALAEKIEQAVTAIDPADPYVEAAVERWSRDGEIEIDEDAVVSRGDDPGAYVMGWLWVTNEDAGLPSEGADDED